MKLIILFTFLVLLTGSSGAHPLHLSITNITYENGKLKINMKSFRDDWETAYFHYHSQPIDFTKQEKREIPWFHEYLNQKFKISLKEGDTPFKLEIDTVKIEEDAIILEMHGRAPSKPNSLYIYNALLTDIYPDQTNLVIFGFMKRETGIKFDVKKLSAVVLLK